MQTPNVSEKNAVSIFRAEGQGWEVMTYRIWGKKAEGKGVNCFVT
jgi:hypothetical protein